MKKQLIFSLCLLALVGCQKENPLTKVTPDTLAKAINQFDEHEMGNGAIQCAEAFAKKIKTNPFQESVCEDYANALQKGLSKHPVFAKATVDNVKDSATWQHYLVSTLAKKSRGMSWME
ncbi:MAG: hypothetical protein LEGION0398_MBIBDBAK_00230 [Legionellaceae bacterium]